MIPETFARQMASKVAARELIAARALGHDDASSYALSAGSETYEAVYSEEKPLVTMGLRMIGMGRHSSEMPRYGVNPDE